MKFLKNILHAQTQYILNHPKLKRLAPLFLATEDFFFGTAHTTKIAPHIVDNIDIKRYMSFVIIGLLPATLAGIYFYGLRMLSIIIVSYTFGGIVEVIFAIVRRKPIYEGFLVTGLIFPLVLPPTIPLWMVAVGIMFGIFFGKEVFGGTGRNIFNVALTARVFLSMAFPEQFASMWAEPYASGLGGFVKYGVDSITSATPLILFKGSHVLDVSSYMSMFLGNIAGSIGETSKIAIIVGGLFLCITRIADWRIPLSYIVSVAICSYFLNYFSPQFAPPIFQLLAGGVLFGAFFMMTDPVTAPLTFEGKWIAGFIAGVLTVLIRGISGFAEGVMFAILLTNAVCPLIDSLIMNYKFKERK